ncbi:hypothetical protein PSTT_01773 [Puccinia striiformis]|uniref:Uncharacterized protein n=1 Tax=Puccinia striiformis TaxID=27350 RepID=A0A2S4W289_9BASI|nr:hypothetical protein PSTT_01773 [Puccinia striiformis]
MMTAQTRRSKIQAWKKRTSMKICCFTSKPFTLSNIPVLVAGLHSLQTTVTGT